MLAAMLAISGMSQAQVNPTPRTRVQMEDSLTSHVQPNAHRASDPDEKGYAHGMDYTHESRLNDRTREEQRHKARVRKEQTRSLQ
ncbi:hypothetical protein WJ84_03455 [Burkholderia ubonensis]|nr:hypothetical protein WJ84_03455 [Burkholderia ubonensis]